MVPLGKDYMEWQLAKASNQQIKQPSPNPPTPPHTLMLLTQALCPQLWALPNDSIFYLTPAERASLVKPAREVMINYDLKHWLARMPARKII